jgi:hypothetical protein
MPSHHKPKPPPTPTPTPTPSSLALIDANWTQQYQLAVPPAIYSFSGGQLTMAPQATTDSNSYGVLVLSKLVARYFDITVTYNVLEQFRSPNPNDWEVFWLWTNYIPKTDGNGNEVGSGNDFLPKTSGCECGTVFGLTGQTEVATPTKPSILINTLNTVRVLKTATATQAWSNGVQFLSTTNKGFYDQSGNFGLYSEDSKILVTNVQVQVTG